MKMQEKIEIAIRHMKNELEVSGRIWISPTEIGKVVGGEKKHSSYGSPICKKAVELGLMTRNDNGHYALTGAAND